MDFGKYEKRWDPTVSNVEEGSSKGHTWLVCTVRLVLPIFIETVVGPFCSVIVQGPVHRGSSFPPVGLDNKTCCPTDSRLSPQPPYV